MWRVRDRIPHRGRLENSQGDGGTFPQQFMQQLWWVIWKFRREKKSYRQSSWWPRTPSLWSLWIKFYITLEHQKPFQCEVCKKGFATGQRLRTHQNIHTDVKPFQCRLCSIGFNDKSNRNSHQKGCSKKLSSQTKNLEKELTLMQFEPSYASYETER